MRNFDVVPAWREGFLGRLGIVLAILLGIAGCFFVGRCCVLDSSVRSGRIVGHSYNAAWTQLVWISTDGKGGGYFRPVQHSEEWLICLHGLDSRGQERDVWLQVDQTDYRNIQDGEEYKR